ncbi:hypothetical protein ETH_00006750 [Eimeria tenella]|uniref:Uncharacterized protein n=1 Tax=Eimeria tenella TaxID=5802 RepID=U6L482_EIMTE|nr:hypothetical protein ETH_00006750 [Eimeria tenella]CDJ42580.1 hypothetical protein ETH_00006750 [Eimeria tenella]|eukprot:XP_013233330.1 hypothetical protein ETH_00006750 [Eimeria tenella]
MLLNPFNIFGIVSDSAEDLNYEQQDAATAAAAAAAEPFVDCIAEFREKVRSVSARGLRALSSIPAAAAAAAKEPSGEAESAAAGEPAAAAAAAAAKELFQELLLLEEVLRELQLRKVEEQKKEAARELERKNQAEALLKKQLEAQIEPKEYFKETQKGVYGTFDEEGIPLTFADGKEIPKSQRKNLAKLLEKHKKAHEKYHGEKKP